MKNKNDANQGVALVTVIMVMLITMILSSIVLSYATTQAKTEAHYEKRMTTLHSIEAGVQEYLWDLNKESVDSVPFDTDITYPEYNPVVSFQLDKIEAECTESKIVIEATGYMLNDPSIIRKIRVTYIKRSFTQYVYFSDNDPSNIYWSDGNKCYGPYHTNTNLYINGSPKFYGKVTYVNNIIIDDARNDHPQFMGGKAKVARINYPVDNQELKTYAQSEYTFDGRTSIRLNSNGTITVWNPRHGIRRDMPLPPNGVIYVDGTTASASNKFDNRAGNVFISGVLNGKLTVAAKNDIYITDYDPTYQYFRDADNHSTNGITYADTDFILDLDTGYTTVTGSGQDDMIGLIADNNVGLLTRGWFDETSASAAMGEIRVYGAVFAINGSFINSYQMNGSVSSTYPSTKSNLVVRGAIIQKTRGAVGMTTSGYNKDYAHDPRMMYEAPPYFLRPDDSGWEILEWTEIE
jgi:Tfp pilus assembly protein PilX